MYGSHPGPRRETPCAPRQGEWVFIPKRKPVTEAVSENISKILAFLKSRPGSKQTK